MPDSHDGDPVASTHNEHTEETHVHESLEVDPIEYGPADVLLAPLAWLSDRLARYGLYLALVTALTATLGSLYFSEVRNLDPCVLCWYQRILLYPLVLILAVGILRRDSKVHTYVLTFTSISIPTSVYHYLVQKTDWFSDATVCRHGVPCSAMYIDWFGFVTIPLLALVAALLISFATSAWMRSDYRDAPTPHHSRPWVPVLVCIACVAAFYIALYRVVG